MPELSGTFGLSPRDYHIAGSAGEYGYMYNHSDKVSFIWSVADLIRDTFKRSKYQDVILPFTGLRRIDCVLEPTRPTVQETYFRLKGKLDNLAPQLSRAAGFAFYNTSSFNFERLCSDAPNL